MSKKLLFLISFVLVLGLVTSASAYDTVVWDNNDGAGDRLWNTATNWTVDAGGPAQHKVPVAGDWAIISDQYTDDGNGPIIQAGDNAVCAWLDNGWGTTNPLPASGDAVFTMTGGTLTAVGDGTFTGEIQLIDAGADGNAVFNMSGGTVTVNNSGGATADGFISVGDDGAGHATFNMDGGVVDVNGSVSIAYWGSLPPKILYGTVNMNAGEINIGGSLTVSEWSDTEADINMTGGVIDVNNWVNIGGFTVGRTGNGHVALKGGTITCDLLGMGGGGVGTLDLAGGTMIMDGDVRGENGWLYDPCSDTPACDVEVDCPDEWYVYTGTIAKLADQGFITAYDTNVGDIITDGNHPSQVGLRSAINLDYDVTNPGKTTITAGAVDPNLAWDPDPLNGSGGLIPPDRLSWAAGDNAASHEVYFGTSFAEVDSADTTDTTGIYKGPNSLGDVNYPVSTTYGKTYYWRIDEVNGATTWKGTVWNFATTPAWATNPSPPDNAGDVPPINVVLSWDPGPEVVTHNLYLGTDFNDVNDRLITPATPGTSSYSPGALELDTTYYWVVDEVNLAADVNVWAGQVWSFTTDDHLVVDDFDSYVNTTALTNVWNDWFVNGSDATITVEKDPNFTRDGNAVKFSYLNTSKKGGNPPTYHGSWMDANVVDLGAGSDWTYAGVKALTLYFRGEPTNNVEKMWVELGDTSSNIGYVLYDGDANHIASKAWRIWEIDLNDFSGVSLTNVDSIKVGVGGTVRTGQSAAGTQSYVYFDDIELWPPYCRTELVPADFDGDCDTDGFDLDILAGDWLLYDYNFIAAEPCDANLIGWWKFDEGSGTIASDSAGSNDGNVFEASWTTGYPNDPCDSGLGFDGDEVVTFDRVVCAVRDGDNPGTYPAELMPDTFTIACWVKFDSFKYFGTFVTNGRDGDDECGFYLYNYGWLGQNGQDFGLGIRTETAMNYLETANIYGDVAGTWTHLAATYDDANTATIYVNGLLAAGPTDVGGPMRWISGGTDSYPNNFFIGCLYFPADIYGDHYFADSKIDDVRFYNFALSQGDIAVLGAGIPPGTDVYQPVPSVANITDPEAQGDRFVNFADYGIVADNWLVEVLWP